MQNYKLENIDCFYFQYNHCTNGQCKFQHRQSCKDSLETCLDWFRHGKCKNLKCPRKHLNHEVMLVYFLCTAEKATNHCTQLNCPMYHEKARQFIVLGSVPPDPVPMVPAVRREKMVNFVRLEEPRVQNFIKSGNQFVKKVLPFIVSSVQEGKLTHERGRAYFKEILHTILFWGSINIPIIEPEEILGQAEVQLFTSEYPDVFQKYNTHLPARPPYTVLLDMVVKITGTNNVDGVLECLLDLSEQMVVKLTNANSSICGNVFVSTVISYCYFWDAGDGKQKTGNYFGASVSCKGRQQTEIMIDILCSQTWHRKIGQAVCLGNWYKNQALWFPPDVHSMAYKISFPEESPSEPGTTPINQHDHTEVESGGEETTSLENSTTLILRHVSASPKAPCERCIEMFPNLIYHPNPEYHQHPYWEHGNCAECESLSQLLCDNQQIVKKLRFSAQGTNLQPSPEQIIQPDLLIHRKVRRLEDNLRSLGFTVGDPLSLYDPSGLVSTAPE
ncbi:uncharacterized protein [Heterodontus francisci]|uniref:uncharacterized protein n=1 Tax=Heterodontus francisci TaxID=7792 RepID=UPI00355C32D2